MKYILSVIIIGLFVPVYSWGQSAVLETFPLSAVQLSESPFSKAQQDDDAYILSLDEDRLLAPFMKDAGITPLKENYGNWESDGLDGHTGGHYLSACAQMYEVTGKAVYLEKLNYMLDWLQKCQKANGNGYVGGIPNGKKLWAEIAKGNVGAIYSRWAPWYNIHKLYSGLVDVYLLTGNEKAKTILVGLSQWCWTLTAGLTEAQMQQMLGNEHGGMNEVFANVAYITKDPKYLELAKRFSHQQILKPLLEKKDSLTGLHANTQIPKVVGFMRIAQLTGDQQWQSAADFFWQTVTHNRSVAFGGNSVREHFNPVDDFMPMLESREGPETCNSYNMLKLTKELFLSKPLASYMDYYERTMYNHILSSEHPGGGFVYFTPIRPNHYKVYSSPQQSFWCCVGTGMENHAKYGELIYAHNNSELYVNLFVASKLQWKEKDLELKQETTFPFSETTQLKISARKPVKLTLKIRQPSWISGAMEVTVNGQRASVMPANDGYLSIQRKWKQGDVITVKLPMKTTAEILPDSSHWLAFLHGPIVLAAATDSTDLKGIKADDSRWGHIAGGKLVSLADAPLLIIDDTAKNSLPTETDSGKLVFSVKGLVSQEKFKQLKLIPFYQVQDSRYIVYWPYVSKNELPKFQAALQQKEQEKQRLDAATLDVIYMGEQQPEADHNFKGENTKTGFFRERHFRNGSGWFSYDLKNIDKQAGKLALVLYGADKDRQVEIFANGEYIGLIDLKGADGNEFVTKFINLPPKFLNEQWITVLFKAKAEKTIPNIYELRLLRNTTF